MKILLIVPPQEGFLHTTERHFPSGLLYIAEACIKNGYNVQILDAIVYKNQPYDIDDEQLTSIQRNKILSNPIFNKLVHYGCRNEEILEFIGQYKPNIVGISIMFSCFYNTGYKLVNEIKKYFLDVVIVVGGAHATTSYKHICDYANVDYILRYEGERSFIKLAKYLEEPQKRDLYEITGIVFRDNFKFNEFTNKKLRIYCNKDEQEYILLNNNKMAYELINYELYDKKVSLITSRGCPCNCSFCSVHLSMGKKYRASSVDCVVKEIEEYYNKYSIREFNIEDDNFTLDIGRAKAILKEIVRKKIKVKINMLNGIMSYQINEEMIKLFYAAGVVKFFVGMESTSEQLLNNINKKYVSYEKTREVIDLATKYGMEAGASLIIGFPTQTIKEIIDDVIRMFSHNILILAINPLYPIVGTEMYKECIRENILKGNEDYTFLGGDNFIIQNGSFDRADIYYLWITVRALTKWNRTSNKYDSFNTVTFLEMLNIFEKKVCCKVLLEENNKFTCVIPSALLKSEIYSSNYKVFKDMINTYFYIRTEQYFRIEVEEFKDIILFRFISPDIEIPKVLELLKKEIGINNIYKQ